MRMKKLLAAALACCTALSSVPVLSAIAEGPAETAAPDLVFDFQTKDGSNEVTIRTDELADSDQSVDVKLYVPSNPGVNGISLKMQINDGEVGEDKLFGNYGFTMTSANYASPYCFDSEKEGDYKQSFQQLFVADQMNLSWVYRYSQEENADSSSEEGRTSWDDSVSWAYDKAFAVMTLNVPKGTPVGEYVFDIRRDTYINAVTLGADKQWPAKSTCTAAGSVTVDFKSVPLKIIVAEPETTTTTEETTTSESTTTTEQTTSAESTTTTEQTTSAESTTTTEQTTSAESTTTTEQTTSAESTTTTEQTTSAESTTTTRQTTSAESTTTTEQTTVNTSSESVPGETTTEQTILTDESGVVEEPDIENSYENMAEGMYMVVGDVSGAPGARVKVPVYVYNDPGTAGMALYWVYPEELKVTRFASGDAYTCSAQPSSKTMPISYVFTCPEGKDQKAADGSVICYITFTIPEDAKDGKVYKIEWIEESGKMIAGLDKYSQAVNTDRVDNMAKFFPGTITVNASGDAALNYTSLSFVKKGQQTKLAILGAKGTDLTWSSSDETVATVDSNGMVTAQSDSGDCVIEASFVTGGEKKTLSCKVHVGLFGDVNGDGRVTAQDASLALAAFTERAVLGMSAEERSLTPEQEKIGDVDLDGRLMASDASYILTYFTFTIAGDEGVTWYRIIGNPDLPDAP